MNCQICLEKYNTANRIPKNLNCGHTFCDRCLKKITTGLEIECPKCRQKSKNNLPICYALYDYLLIEAKSDLDEPCKFHEYEKLQFYCNIDNIMICALCLTSTHKGHEVSSIKDKVIADDNIDILLKWNNYFQNKKEEYTNKNNKISNIIKDFEKMKLSLSSEINEKYDNLISEFNKSKEFLNNEIDETYLKEHSTLIQLKDKIDSVITNSTNFLEYNKALVEKIDDLSNSEILSIDLNDYRNKEKEMNKILETLIQEKNKISFKTINWFDDIFFNRKEIKIENLLNEDSIIKNSVLFFGDSKDKLILSFDLRQKSWNKIETSYGGENEFLDYSCVVQYKKNLLLITGGCVYSNYRNTATRNTFLAKITTKDEISITPFKPLLSERFSHGSCLLNGVPYVFGGHNGIHTLSTMEYFDEKENMWKDISNGMMVEREIFAHCTIKDKYIYVFGGFNDTHLDTIEKYDSIAKKWIMLNVKMMRCLQNATAVAIGDDQIALIGGYNGSMHKSIDILNLNNKSWTFLSRMNVPRRKSHCYEFENKIFIIGGEGTDVDQYIPEILDLSNGATFNCDAYEIIISKAMNFWTSTFIN